MKPQADIDRLLRNWLDEDELTPPDHPVWAALERVETTRQRGALRVSLEERLVRIHPVVSVAAVAVTAVIGLAIYLSLGGGPNVGDPEASPSPAAGAMTTSEFATAMALTPPDDWTIVEASNSMVITRLEGGRINEQIAVFTLDNATIWSGMGDGHVPFPSDLGSWLEDYPVATMETGPASVEITATGSSSTAVDGAAAEVVTATTRFTASPDAESTMNFVVAESRNVGTDALIFEGDGQIQFVIVAEPGLLFTYHATDSEFDPERMDSFLASVTFLGD